LDELAASVVTFAAYRTELSDTAAERARQQTAITKHGRRHAIERNAAYVVGNRKQMRREVSAHIVQFDHAVVHHGYDAMDWTSVAFMGEPNKIELPQRGGIGLVRH
jgi:hypothetical protein